MILMYIYGIDDKQLDLVVYYTVIYDQNLNRPSSNEHFMLEVKYNLVSYIIKQCNKSTQPYWENFLLD